MSALGLPSGTPAAGHSPTASTGQRAQGNATDVSFDVLDGMSEAELHTYAYNAYARTSSAPDSRPPRPRNPPTQEMFYALHRIFTFFVASFMSGVMLPYFDGSISPSSPFATLESLRQSLRTSGDCDSICEYFKGLENLFCAALLRHAPQGNLQMMKNYTFNGLFAVFSSKYEKIANKLVSSVKSRGHHAAYAMLEVASPGSLAILRSSEPPKTTSRRKRNTANAVVSDVDDNGPVSAAVQAFSSLTAGGRRTVSSFFKYMSPPLFTSSGDLIPSNLTEATADYVLTECRNAKNRYDEYYDQINQLSRACFDDHDYDVEWAKENFSTLNITNIHDMASVLSNYTVDDCFTLHQMLHMFYAASAHIKSTDDDVDPAAVEDNDEDNDNDEGGDDVESDPSDDDSDVESD